MIRAMHSSALLLLLALAVNGVLAHGQNSAPARPASQRVTLAQIFVNRDVGKNLAVGKGDILVSGRVERQVFCPLSVLSSDLHPSNDSP